MDGDISKHQEEIDRSPLRKYFNLDRADEYESDFDEILEWAKERGIKKTENLAIELKKIEQKLGTTYVGENRIKRIRNYISNDVKLTRVLKEMSAQERGWEDMG